MFLKAPITNFLISIFQIKNKAVSLNIQEM